MPDLGPYGSVRGALSNERPYRDSGAPGNRINGLQPALAALARQSLAAVGWIKIGAAIRGLDFVPHSAANALLRWLHSSQRFGTNTSSGKIRVSGHRYPHWYLRRTWPL
jgi:hypothetical protein